MIDISSAKLTKLIVHRIGNKLRDEGFTFSEHEIDHASTLDDLLLRNYLSAGIKLGELYDFYHESDLSLNVINHFSNLIFQNSDTFAEHTKSIAKHLYSASTHPNIGGGEFISILFGDIRTEDDRDKRWVCSELKGKVIILM